MNNRLFLIIIGIGILVACMGLIMTHTASAIETVELGWNLFDYGLQAGEITGLLLLLANGSFIDTKHFRIALGVFAFLLIGVLWKILHWEYANHIVITGIIGIMLAYFISFLEKTHKVRLDYLKLTWVVVSFTCSILLFLRLINREYAELGHYVLWLAIIDFAMTGLKKGTLFRQSR